MLSIGKRAAGQAKYYLDQAEERVDVAQSVGEGIEDYYLTPREARGQWIGAAAREASGSAAMSRPRRFATCWPGWTRATGLRCGHRAVRQGSPGSI